MLPEIRILAKHGFGVLAFDWPGQGQSSGKVTMSAPDRAAVTSAIDWLSSRSDIDAYRIGVFGFSAGGYLVGQTALLDKRIRAIAIAGTMPSFASRLTLIYKRFGPLAQWAARYADKVYGLDLAELVLSERIHELSCPLLVVAGTNDPLVPEESAVINFINGPIPKEYFLVPGAHHGDYSEIAPVQYEQKLAAFYERWLLDH
jgi:pimeloyl-ACP methyl ester carboxylesterase